MLTFFPLVIGKIPLEERNDLNRIHRGANGNPLHQAAARGHAKLVKALHNNTPCREVIPLKLMNNDLSSLHSSDSSIDNVVQDRCQCHKNEGFDVYPLSVDWEHVRGHTDDVVSLFEAHGSFHRQSIA